MARYIDADALGIGKCNPDIMQNKAHAEGWNLLLDIINNAPTADVAPVVRCQGCELCKPQDIKNTYDNKTERGLFCHYWRQKVYPDDFCSYGERKDGVK